jgi:hypothetical protein
VKALGCRANALAHVTDAIVAAVHALFLEDAPFPKCISLCRRDEEVCPTKRCATVFHDV